MAYSANLRSDSISSSRDPSTSNKNQGPSLKKKRHPEGTWHISVGGIVKDMSDENWEFPFPPIFTGCKPWCSNDINDITMESNIKI